MIEPEVNLNASMVIKNGQARMKSKFDSAQDDFEAESIGKLPQQAYAGGEEATYEDFEELFILKCRVCETIFDFTGDTVRKRDQKVESRTFEAKNMKREYLKELIDLFDQETAADKQVDRQMRIEKQLLSETHSTSLAGNLTAQIKA